MIASHPLLAVNLLALSVLGAASPAGATNLVPNGGMDQADADRPAGWHRVDGSDKVLIWASDHPQAGAGFLKLDSRAVPQDARPQWHLETPIPLQPGGTYRLDFYFRIDASNL